MKEKKVKKRKQPLVSDQPMDVDMDLLVPSFKESKRDNRDELLRQFDVDKTQPVNKNNITEVLEKKTEAFKQLPEENKAVIKKGIELELLYNYDPLPTPKKRSFTWLLPLALVIGVILLLGAYIIF